MPFKYTEEEYEKDKKKKDKDDYVGDFERIKGMIREQKKSKIQKL